MPSHCAVAIYPQPARAARGALQRLRRTHGLQLVVVAEHRQGMVAVRDRGLRSVCMGHKRIFSWLRLPVRFIS